MSRHEAIVAELERAVAAIGRDMAAVLQGLERRHDAASMQAASAALAASLDRLSDAVSRCVGATATG